MQPVRRVAFIPAPSVQIVDPKSRSKQLSEAEDARQKAGVNKAPVLSPAEIEKRQAEAKAAKRNTGKAKPATAPKSSPAPASKPAMATPTAPTPKAVEPPKPKIYLTRSVVRGLVLEAVKDRTMTVIEGAIRLAFLDGQAPRGAFLESVLHETFYGKANPIRPSWAPLTAEIKAIFGGGIVSPTVERVTRNPLAESLRDRVQRGELSQEQARAMLLATTKDVKVVEGDQTKLMSRSALITDVSVRLPPELVSARLAPEEKGEGKTISLTFTMLRRGTSDNDKAKALLTATFRQTVANLPLGGTTAERQALAGQTLGWTVESAYAAWEATGELPGGLTIPETDVEVEASKQGTPGKLLAWAVGFLNENADCSRIVFDEGTILTVYYNDPTTDPRVRAILGDPDGDGIAIKRSWFGDGEDGSADLRAASKGRDLMTNGLKVGQKVYPVGTDLTDAVWAKPLKPGQYTKIGTVEDKETGVEYPALFLMQKITGYKVDHVLRHEAIRSEGRGNALPTVENTISASGKNGGAVLDKKSYEKKGFSGWMAAGKTDRCHFSRG